ncbi:MAG: hypothetical protein GY938_20640 [Ketobacter sp.]|nr:hypothetical protein [Ketobacter sp.]
MHLSWRQRAAKEPHLCNLAKWPLVDTSLWPRDKKRRFLRNQTIVSRVLAGERFSEIAYSTGVTQSTISKIMQRCLAGDDAMEPALSSGLIPGARLAPNQRRKPLASFERTQGAACSFSALLRSVPGLEVHLNQLIASSVRQHRRGQNLRIKSFHCAFLRYLETKQWPHDRYPYTEASLAYESLRTYLNRKLAEYHLPITPKRVILPKDLTRRIFAEVQIDEQTIDCHGSVAIELNDQMQPFRIARLNLVLARDVASGCLLGYHIALTQHPTADDMLQLLSQILTRWVPRDAGLEGLSCLPGAGFPSALGESFTRPAIGMIRMDNALSHLANKVRHVICYQLGAALNFGLVKQPKGRNVIEQAFAKLNVDIHRFPSTSGSHPQDPVAEPAKHKRSAPYVSLRVLEKAIEAILADHNVRILGNMASVTPLDQMTYQMAHHLIPLLPPNAAPELRNPLMGYRIVSVRKSKDDDHPPHINFEKVKYRGDAIRNADLINNKVNITFKIQDIRTLSVSTLDGKQLGVIYAPKTWQRFPHSLTTRKYINKLIRDHSFSAQDPLANYFEYALQHRHLPEKALELVRIYREYGQHSIPLQAQSGTVIAERHEPKKALRDALDRVPDWSPSMVHHRR